MDNHFWAISDEPIKQKLIKFLRANPISSVLDLEDEEHASKLKNMVRFFSYDGKWLKYFEFESDGLKELKMNSLNKNLQLAKMTNQGQMTREDRFVRSVLMNSHQTFTTITTGGSRDYSFISCPDS